MFREGNTDSTPVVILLGLKKASNVPYHILRIEKRPGIGLKLYMNIEDLRI